MTSVLVRALDGLKYRYDRFITSLPSRGSDCDQISKRRQDSNAISPARAGIERSSGTLD
jgi:hypothetical protein